MATKVHMEALSPTMEEGRLVKWTKHEGDAVKSGDTLAEVETDKAVMELVARADGQLIKVMVPEGTTVPVGNVVAWIGKPGEKVDGAGSGEQGAAAPKPAPTASATPARTQPAAPPTPGAAPADATRVKASPLAKRIAKDAGVDLKLVQGSGPGGRRSEEHTSELQSHLNLVCRLLLEKKKKINYLFCNIKKKKKKM